VASPLIPVIHAITNDEIAARPGFADRAEAVMRALGGRGAVHLRTHRLSGAELHSLARRLSPIQNRTDCWLVINDRVDVALATGARGIQLTSKSLSIPDARSIAPGVPLGASVHSVGDAVAAERDGASWAVAGHVFETTSHPAQPGRGEEFVAAVVRSTSLPVIAIGGIRAEDVPGIRRAGAWGVAVIRGIWGESDAQGAAIDYLSRYDANGGH
jgi:thiazole tautomerase (transcriptional regulator TenI)